MKVKDDHGYVKLVIKIPRYENIELYFSLDISKHDWRYIHGSEIDRELLFFTGH